MSTAKEVRISFRGVDKTRLAFGKIRQNLSKLQKMSKSLLGGFSNLGLGISACFSGVAIKNIVDSGDKIAMLSTRLGASTDALSELQFVAKQSGVEFNSLTTGLQRMTRRISEAARGSGAAKEALQELGLSAKNLNSMTPEQQFEKIADALQKVKNNSDKVRIAMKLFDTEGVSLLQTMQNGAAGIKSMRNEAKKLGLSLSGEQAKSMAEFKQSISKLQFAVQGFLTSALLPLIPAMTEFFSNTERLTGVIKIMGAAMAVLISLKIALWFVEAAKAVRIFSIAIMASPIGRIVASIGALIIILKKLSEKFLETELGAKTLGKGLDKIKKYLPLEELKQTFSLSSELDNKIKEQAETFNHTSNSMANYCNGLEKVNDLMKENINTSQNAILETKNATNNAIENFDKLENTSDKMFSSIIQGSKDASNSLSNNIAEAVVGARGSVLSMSNIFSNFFKELQVNIIKSGINKLFSGIFGALSGGSSGGGLFAGFFASGGKAKPGKIHVVGDGGEPELFIPNSSGSIVPFSKLSRSGQLSSNNIIVNMNISTPNVSSFQKSRGQLMADLARSVESVKRDL